MKKQFYLGVFVLLFSMAKPAKMFAQYDVGVFYMPFWHYGAPGDPLHLSGHWYMIDNYNTAVTGLSRPDLALKPMNLYSPSDAWYDEDMQSVTEKQQELMNKGGIDFVIYENSYARYGYNYYGPYWSGPVENVIKPGFNNHDMKFAIMWADQFLNLVKNPSTNADYCSEFFDDGGGLDQIIDKWIPFITHANYKKIDGKPAIWIFYPGVEGSVEEPNTNSIEGMTGKCKTHSIFSSLGGDIYEPYINHKKTNLLLQLIKSKIAAKTSNAITDIYFTAVLTAPVSHEYTASGTNGHVAQDWAYKWSWLIRHPKDAGYNAVTTYGYTYFEYDDAYAYSWSCKGYYSWNNWPYDYSKMRYVYNRYYDYMLSTSEVTYQMPVTPGFNRGSINMTEPALEYPDACNYWAASPRDQAKSSPYTFSFMLQDAKTKANASYENTVKSRNIYIISAWNEYGEGNVIEPTEYYGYDYLNYVRSTFKPWLPVVYGKPGLAGSATLEGSNTTGFDFTVIPNPTKDILNLAVNKNMYDQLSFYLYDFGTHSLVKSWENQQKQAGYGFDIKGLKSGQYILEMKAGKQKKSRQVIISK